MLSASLTSALDARCPLHLRHRYLIHKREPWNNQVVRCRRVSGKALPSRRLTNSVLLFTDRMGNLTSDAMIMFHAT